MQVISSILALIVLMLTVPFAFRYRTANVSGHVMAEDVSASSSAATSIVEITEATSLGNISAFVFNVRVDKLWKVEPFVLSYQWAMHVIFYVLPLILLFIFNSFIIRALWRTREHRRKFPARRRITIMLVTVTMVFMMCITPDTVMSTVLGLGYTESDYFVKGVREITDLLVTANSAVNFLLYCSFHEAFREHFTAVLHCRCSRSSANCPDEVRRSISPQRNLYPLRQFGEEESAAVLQSPLPNLLPTVNTNIREQTQASKSDIPTTDTNAKERHIAVKVCQGFFTFHSNEVIF